MTSERSLCSTRTSLPRLARRNEEARSYEQNNFLLGSLVGNQGLLVLARRIYEVIIYWPLNVIDASCGFARDTMMLR
jgi:hypothetical protein